MAYQRCKECCKSDARAVFEANPEPYRERARAVPAEAQRCKDTYGLTKEAYYAILDKQIVLFVQQQKAVTI